MSLPDDIITENGTKYLPGKNGKRWRLAPVPYHDRPLAEAMSAIFYGKPPLNDCEQQVYDIALPFLEGMQQHAENEFDEPSTFGGGGPVINLDPESVAYQIAESVAAEPLFGAAPLMLEILNDLYHQLATDADLEKVTAAKHYETLCDRIAAVLAKADPSNPQIIQRLRRGDFDAA